jgi:uncharacterized membrane protein YhaH (DUF805 family)
MARTCSVCTTKLGLLENHGTDERPLCLDCGEKQRRCRRCHTALSDADGGPKDSGNEGGYCETCTALIERGEQAEGIPVTEEEKRDRAPVFQRPFSFTGRIGRGEFGVSFLLVTVVTLIAEMVIMGGGYPGSNYLIPSLVVIVAVAWFSLAQGIKRCHDLGNSGWYLLIPFYPLWILFAEGNRDKNRYGEDPRHFVARFSSKA